MNGDSLFLDTNIILYLVSGDQTIVSLLDDKIIFISFVTELELLGYKKINENEEKYIKEFLKDITVIDINSEIKDLVVEFRKKYNLKLPDLIIAATSFFLKLPFVTSDKKFSDISELNLILYER
jgi:predicted nucleic acid-binding protein